jgi:hypothetical protein
MGAKAAPDGMKSALDATKRRSVRLTWPRYPQLRMPKKRDLFLTDFFKTLILSHPSVSDRRLFWDHPCGWFLT